MGVEPKNNYYRMYAVIAGMLIAAICIVIKLTNIQWVEGDHYRKIAKEKSVKTFVIPANKGNVYSADGSLLATSVPNYTIRFDAMAPSKADFDKEIGPLASALSKKFNKPKSEYLAKFLKARRTENRYLLVEKGLSYTDYMEVKSFPLFNKGTYKGGMIVDQQTVREHPIGKIAERTIGYERVDGDGQARNAGIEGAFSQYLNGKDGKVLKQKIAKGQWKPIRDNNEIEPQDGYDVISTIDVYIQDIAHHALLKQLEHYSADHGCVVVMETKTGAVKAISNLGRDSQGNYYEKLNYAVGESHEPGSTFKLLDLIALLEDEKADTSSVYDSNGGVISYRGKLVKDSKKGGYGKISLARGFELSSNTVLVQAVYKAYKSDPRQFVDRIYDYKMHKPLGLPFAGEGQPVIRTPDDPKWSAISLPWMAFGYGVAVTPLQTLTLYNAVANNGEMVKPQFVKEIREWNRVIKKFDKEIIHPKICSDKTIDKLHAVLENVVKRGTASSLYSKDFSMAGKTGTAQVDYNKGEGNLYYTSSFVGYFPANNPKYSCIVVVHKPNVAKGYYGADVAGPVFKRIAQKIFTDSPTMNKIKGLQVKSKKVDQAYETYIAKSADDLKRVPNVKGMPGMDAAALLENLKLKVRVRGIGKVKKQSIPAGEPIKKNETIILELS